MKRFILGLLLIASYLAGTSGVSLAADNLALHKHAWANNEYTPAYAAANAVDGNPATNWNASSWASASNPLWLKVDLGEMYDINRIYLASRDTGCDSSYGVLYNLYVSADGSSWKNVYSGSMYDDPALYYNDLLFSKSPLPARYVEYEVVGGIHWAHLNEMEVYGASHVAPEPVSAGLFLLGGGALAVARRKKSA